MMTFGQAQQPQGLQQFEQFARAHKPLAIVVVYSPGCHFCQDLERKLSPQMNGCTFAQNPLEPQGLRFLNADRAEPGLVEGVPSEFIYRNGRLANELSREQKRQTLLNFVAEHGREAQPSALQAGQGMEGIEGAAGAGYALRSGHHRRPRRSSRSPGRDAYGRFMTAGGSLRGRSPAGYRRGGRRSAGHRTSPRSTWSPRRFW